MKIDASKINETHLRERPTSKTATPSKTWNGRVVEHLPSTSRCLIQKGIASFTTTENRSSHQFIQKIVDDGWSVTSGNDEIWVEAGTAPGGKVITCAQYENFLDGMRELQLTLESLEKEASQLQIDSIKQKIDELQREKDYIHWDSLKNVFNTLVEAFVIFRGAHPLYAGPTLVFALQNLKDIAIEVSRSIDISKEIEQLRKIERATERDRLQDARQK